MSNENNKKNTNHKDRMPLIIGLVLLGIVLIGNIIMYNIPFQIDLTRSKAYSLSGVTLDLLRKLKDPLNVTIYISEDIPASLNGTTIRRNLQDIMKDFKTYGRANFDYTFVEIGQGQEDDKKRAEAKKLGIEPVVVEIPERIKKTTAQIIAGISISYEKYQESMQIDLRDPTRLEYELVKRIEKMIVKKPINEQLTTAEAKVKITSYVTPDFQQKPIRTQVNDVLNEIKNVNPEKIEIEEKILQTERDYNEAVSRNINLNRSIDFENMSEYITGFGISINYMGKSESIPSVKDLAENTTLFKKEIKDNIANVLSKKSRVGIVMKDYEIISDWMKQNQNIIQQFSMQLSQQQINQLLGLIQKEADKFENPSMEYLTQMSKEFYNIEMVDLNNIENITENYEALIVVSTNSELSEWELFHLDRFIMTGKPVSFLANSIGPNYVKYVPIGEQQRSPFASYASKRSHNLYKVLENYGVKLNDDLIKGSQSFTSTDAYRYPLWLAVNYYRDTPVTKKFNLTTHFGWVSSLETNDEVIENNNIKATPFLQTTNAAQLLKREQDGDYEINILRYVEDGIVPETTEQGKYNIGYLLEGSFKSLFEGQNVPERPVEEDSEDSQKGENNTEEETNKEEKKNYTIIDKSPENTKIAVISDRDFISDWMAQFVGYGIINNIALMQNTIDWMIGKDSLIPVRGKSVRPAQLNQETADKYHNVILWGNVLGLPLIVILIGLILWIRDANKKEKLLKEFNPVNSNSAESIKEDDTSENQNVNDDDNSNSNTTSDSKNE
ncbi:MAG: Gldg family protein [Spirochaetota bacterium]